MPTTSRALFNYEELRSRAIRHHEQRIHDGEHQLDLLNDPAKFSERLAEWRKIQESRLQILLQRIEYGDITDYELSRFKLDSIPSNESWERRNAQDQIREAKRQLDIVIAKGGSLVSNEDCSISLTKTQLAEYFGL